MPVTVAKWGNSLAVCIHAFEIASFDAFYEQITVENSHTETDWDLAVGRENIEC